MEQQSETRGDRTTSQDTSQDEKSAFVELCEAYVSLMEDHRELMECYEDLVETLNLIGPILGVLGVGVDPEEEKPATQATETSSKSHRWPPPSLKAEQDEEREEPEDYLQSYLIILCYDDPE